ncbi:MAG: type VI secretion system ATPase TssH [Phycisphaerae bacterium]|nr:type VI secretion system ATPase TssH [Phycisphaerae bacterium]
MSTQTTGTDFRSLLSRFDENCVRHMQGAMSVCGSRSQFEITPDHFMLRLLDEMTGDVQQIFETFKVDRATLRRAIQRALDQLPTGHAGKPVISPKLLEVFQSAAVMADEFGFDRIRTGLLILAFVLNPQHLKANEFTPELERIDVDQLRDHFHEIVLGSSEQPGGAAGAEGAPAGGRAAPGGSALDQFTIDLTAKAAAGEIDPVFGRDAEIRQMIDIFARRRKNNPILVGEPGTGKTAIVEGLALRITEGDVPPTLKGVKLISLDLGLLQAGAGVKGEFENRLKNVIKEIKSSSQPVITFIDEAHTLIGAGGTAGGSDAANLLKPALARGELRTVAATTWAEYKKYFEKDAALERRFQLVRCDEPDVESAIVMLRGLKDKYEKHHKVTLLDEAVRAAVEISKRYISGRFLPDKAVDLLDTAAARVAVGLSTKPAVLEDVDRRLSHLETAITAIHRDHAGGTKIDETVLAEMEATRESLIQEREALEKRWHEELAAVERVRELRAKLREFTGSVSSENGDGQSDATDAAPAEDSKSSKAGKAAKKSKVKAAPSAEETAIRAEIDQALAALKKIQGESALLYPHVDAGSVAAVVSDWTGIPVGSMVKDEIAASLQMEDRLKGRVVGQDHALTIVAEKLRISKSGLGDPNQPLGVFLCVGPSGVGKTELAMSIADLFFGGERFLTVINMSEFMEAHTVSQLKGSPPGYVGYGEGGVLTEAVRQHPYSVVLLDEVEKAHPDVMNLFYQVFDKGQLADGEGRIIDFKNTVIFLTSNLGTDVIQQMCESGEQVAVDELREAIYPHLRNHFKPALVARMTVIPFFTLGEEILKNISKMKLRKVVKRLATTHNMAMNVDESVYAAIAARCKQVDIGARQIDHALNREVLPAFSREILAKMSEESMPKSVTMGVSEAGDFTYSFSN